MIVSIPCMSYIVGKHGKKLSILCHIIAIGQLLSGCYISLTSYMGIAKIHTSSTPAYMTPWLKNNVAINNLTFYKQFIFLTKVKITYLLSNTVVGPFAFAP